MTILRWLATLLLLLTCFGVYVYALSKRERK